MNQFQRSLSLIFLLFLCLPSKGDYLNNIPGKSKTTVEKNPSELKKTEFRAVWIATINNIDWPSNPNLSVEEQKNEFLKLMETFQKFNLNVVILQVRAASDAFYQSKTEPWSHFLTGKQGKAPKPFYDPLAWAIEMCHQRGMELHAWFNPFRVRNLGTYQLDPNSFAARHPQFVKEFDKKLFLDPGYPEVRSHVIEVIAEVAHNYDVDAIILDDYFYPYPVAGKKFGDQKSFEKYGHHFYPKRINDWRRENINQFVSSLHDTLLKIDPKIKFGISPFGIWRNKSVDPQGSVGLRGLSSYDDLYVDIRKWLMKGWIDYVIPQLYWEKGNRFGDFTSLVQWWSENCYGKSLYIGQALYKTTAEKNGWMLPDELNNQINFLRTNEKIRGFAFYSASNIRKLTPLQVKALCDNQLNTRAAIDDDRHLMIQMEPVATRQIPDSRNIAQEEELIKQEFLQSFDSKPISIREIWKSLSNIKPVVIKMKGNSILRWNIKNDDNNPVIALLSFKKTGKNRYLQNVIEISKTSDFNFSDLKWKELKKTELLLVSKDIKSKTDLYSTFFELKRRRIKSIDNPFKHH